MGRESTLQMNLDELARALRRVSSEKLLAELSQHIEAWKADDRDFTDLEATVERFFGNTWLSSAEDHAKAYALWESFRNGAIRGLPGMTVDQRLTAFSLNDRLDACSNDEQKRVVCSKVHARPPTVGTRNPQG